MKKIVAFVLLMAFASAAQARELSDGTKDRKGFFVGLSVGGGLLRLSAGGDHKSEPAILTDLRLGGGITNNILLMFDGALDQSLKPSGQLFSVYHSDVAVQWFVWENLFLRPSVGADLAFGDMGLAGLTAFNNKISFGGSFATGYEFRLGKCVGLSPELLYRYSRIRNPGSVGNVHSFGAQAGLNFYF